MMQHTESLATIISDMNPAIQKFMIIATVTGLLLLHSDPAWALRCGSRLIKEGMHESQVIELCGEPVSTRRLGYVLRPYLIRRPAGISVSDGTRYVYGGYHHELDVKEMLFNFGPHKLMRLIRFEGGRISDIRTEGYGYRYAAN
jgi:hypothetical protein